MTSILWVPDTQVKAGVATNHLTAAGNYIVEKKPDVVMVAGDWWDMPALNNYASPLERDALRIVDDLEAGKDAMELFLAPIQRFNKNQRVLKRKQYKPRMVFLVGNHDPQVRVPRMIEQHPILQGFLEDNTTEWLEKLGWEVVPFLDVVEIEDIRFSHFFTNSHSAKKGPLGGTADNMLKNAGFSFVQGHTQGLKMTKHYLGDGTRRLGIAAGSFYQQHEKYMGPQGNHHWQGMVMLHEVSKGSADITELSLNYLVKRYG